MSLSLKILNMISGRFVKGDKRAYNKRSDAYNHLTLESEYTHILLMLSVLGFIANISKSSYVYVILACIVLYLINFKIVRINDEHSFIRLFFIVLTGAILLTDKLVVPSILILVISYEKPPLIVLIVGLVLLYWIESTNK